MIQFKCKFLFVTSILILSGCVAFPHRSPADRNRSMQLIEHGARQLEMGFTEQAYASFEMAFEQYPLPDAIDGLGCGERYKGNVENAREFFELALDLEGGYHKARAHLATVAELQGDFDVAEKLYREYLYEVPDDVRIRNNFAAFLYDRDVDGQSRQLARQELIRANSFGPEDLVLENFYKLEEENGERN